MLAPSSQPAYSRAIMQIAPASLLLTRLSTPLLRLRLASFLILAPILPAAGNPNMAGLIASPQDGRAPLSVTFTGNSGGAAYFGGIQIDFGDGETDYFCRPGKACKDTTATHVYAKPGEYIVRLLGQGEGQQSIVASVTLKVD